MNANVLNNNKVAQIFGDSKYLYTLSLSLSLSLIKNPIGFCSRAARALARRGGLAAPIAPQGLVGQISLISQISPIRLIGPIGLISLSGFLLPIWPMASGLQPCHAMQRLSLTLLLIYKN